MKGDSSTPTREHRCSSSCRLWDCSSSASGTATYWGSATQSPETRDLPQRCEDGGGLTRYVYWIGARQRMKGQCASNPPFGALRAGSYLHNSPSRHGGLDH